MATKVHPQAFRLAVTKDWKASWFAASPKAYSDLLREDVCIREALLKDLKDAALDQVKIERFRQSIVVHLFAGKPGVIIGRSGAGIESLITSLKKRFFPGKKVDMRLNVHEVRDPSLCARLVGLQIADDLEHRRPFRRSMKMAIERVLKSRGEGVKITVSGRLNGAEIARTETLSKGRIPLTNLRADIDFATVTAHTTFGVIGIRVWINRGEVFTERAASEVKA